MHPDSEPAGHLSDTRIAALLGGDLSPEAQAAAEAHLENCPARLARLNARSGVDHFAAMFDPGQPRQMSGLRLLEPGERLGGFVIEKQIAAGGAAVVYQAREAEGARRLAALKVLQPSLHRKADSLRRFLLEAKVGSHVQDGGILPVWEVQIDQEPPWIAMPLVEGETLQARLDRLQGQPLSLADLLKIGEALARTLSAAHAAGVIHRDVKPSNILLSTSGSPEHEIDAVYLADFGLARLREEDAGVTKSGLFLGTPQFMSPEQAAGSAEMDVGTDLFSLGVVLYTMSTGQAPFAGETFGELSEAVREQAPPPPRTLNPDLPAWLANLISRLLTKEPAERPPTAADVLETLQTQRNLGTVTGWRLLGKRTRRARQLRAVAIATGLLSIVLLPIWLWAERTGRVSWVNAMLAGRSGRYLYVVGKWGTYATHEEAVAAAQPGDVIEVRTHVLPTGQGGLHIPAGKPITLRAAPGFRPELNVPASGWPPAGLVEADFTMQGFTVNHTYHGPKPGRLLQVRGARLTLKECRFTRPPIPMKLVETAGNALFGLEGASALVIDRCEMYAPNSPLAGVVEPSGSLEVTLTDSKVWSILVWCDDRAPADLTLNVRDSEVFAINPLFFKHAMPQRSLRLRFSGSLVQAIESVLQVPHPLERLRAVLDWQGESNRWAVAGQMVLAQDGRLPPGTQWPGFTIKQYQETGSAFADQLAMPYDPAEFARAMKAGEAPSIRVPEGFFAPMEN